MNFKGDFAKLAKLTNSITKVSKAYRGLCNALGAEAVTQVHLGFRESREPNGTPWMPLKVRRGGKPLEDTGRMRSSFSYTVTGRGFELGSNVTYVKFHQYGTKGRGKAGISRRFVNKRGRLISRAKATAIAAKAEGRLAKVNAAVAQIAAVDPKLARRFRGKQRALGRQAAMNFRTFQNKAGGGKIPARPMVPESTLGPIWSAAFTATGKRFFSRLMK